jgi:hypothetical protein
VCLLLPVDELYIGVIVIVFVLTLKCWCGCVGLLIGEEGCVVCRCVVVFVCLYVD